jgi:2'-5' RNA ligase
MSLPLGPPFDCGAADSVSQTQNAARSVHAVDRNAVLRRTCDIGLSAPVGVRRRRHPAIEGASEDRFPIGDQTGTVSLFVAAWPDEFAVRTLSGQLAEPQSSELRWVKPQDWHVTLAFLGAVPGDEITRLTDAFRSVGPSLQPTTATMGPRTQLLGKSVLCLPVDGLDEIASSVREATAVFNRSSDWARPFLGHLTLARSIGRRRIPREAAGDPIAGAWVVSELRLVSSEVTSEGSRYAAREVVTFGA